MHIFDIFHLLTLIILRASFQFVCYFYYKYHFTTLRGTILYPYPNLNA